MLHTFKYDYENQSLQETPFLIGKPHLSQDLGAFAPTELSQYLKEVKPHEYGKTRNYFSGDVTKLSPFVENGIINNQLLVQLAQESAEKEGEPMQSVYHFLQQVCWREFFQRKLKDSDLSEWESIHPYRTGWTNEEYQDELPDEILLAQTSSALINSLIASLYSTGYLHNRARLFIAAYIVHWKRVKWQTGAQWMLQHLLDGNIASNNYSWQWVASTGSNKPYIFNLDNAQNFGADYFSYETLSPEKNTELLGTYEDIFQRLFPKMGKSL